LRYRPVPTKLDRKNEPFAGAKVVDMHLRRMGSMDLPTASFLLVIGLFGYASWLTSIVFCATNGLRPLLIATAMFFPVGIVHGIGVWFGGW
jgi:hypothetical protein